MDLLEFEQDLWEQGYQYIAGVDEAGRGPLAGPVVAAAVIFPSASAHLEMINDSKKLSHSQRQKAMKIIKENALAIGVGIVSNEDIDKINILQATYKAMTESY